MGMLTSFQLLKSGGDCAFVTALIQFWDNIVFGSSLSFIVPLGPQDGKFKKCVLFVNLLFAQSVKWSLKRSLWLAVGSV